MGGGDDTGGTREGVLEDAVEVLQGVSNDKDRPQIKMGQSQTKDVQKTL